MNRLQQAKCGESPTGAHHWMIPGTGLHPLGRCKWCGEEKEFQGVYGSENWDAQRRHSQVIYRSTKLAGQFEPLPDN